MASDERITPCWPYPGARTGKGYGSVYWGGRHVLAHRLAYELRSGQIPAGMCVLHRCDNPPCVNPLHLFLGTRGDNNRDRTLKGRGANENKTHCPKGHPYAPDNIHPHSNRRGRNCRACALDRMRRYYQTVTKYRRRDQAFGMHRGMPGMPAAAAGHTRGRTAG